MAVNSQYFTEEQIKAGQLQKLLDFLMSEAYDEGDYYNDVHIYPADCGAFVVEWVQVPWSHEYGGKFEYIDEDQIVMLDKRFPDGHYEQCFDLADYQNRLTEWFKENSDYLQEDDVEPVNNETDSKDFQKYLEKYIAEQGNTEIHYENGVPQGDYDD